MPYICIIKAVPKWISGPSCRLLDRRETIFHVHIWNSYSIHLKCNVAVQVDLSLAMKMKLRRQTRSAQYLLFFSRR